MKYGILIHQTTKNIGEDIQTYASAKLLPQIDYVIERENLDTFCSDDGEPVGVIMAHWWLQKKWNWPPSECIYPLMTGMHINLNNIYKNGTPVGERWLGGIGGDYFRAYGPVGARDTATVNYLKENRIPAYFSGSIVLTLPKAEKTEDAGTYVCLSDMNETQTSLIQKKLEGSEVHTLSVTHKLAAGRETLTLEERFAQVEEKLTVYQNARCVVTKRLTTALACLAMEVPVLAVVNLTEESVARKWEPYKEWVHFAEADAFKAGEYSYDFVNPPENPQNYRKTREELLQRVQTFVKECEQLEGRSVSQIRKTSYTKEEAALWQNRLMKESLEAWLHESRGMLMRNDEDEHMIRVIKKKLHKDTAPEVTDFLSNSEMEKLANRQPVYLKQLAESFQK